MNEPPPDTAITAEAVDDIARLLHESGCGDGYRCADLAERAVAYVAPALRAQGADTVLDRVRQFRDKHNPQLNHVCCVSDLLYELLGGAS